MPYSEEAATIKLYYLRNSFHHSMAQKTTMGDLSSFPSTIQRTPVPIAYLLSLYKKQLNPYIVFHFKNK